MKTMFKLLVGVLLMNATAQATNYGWEAGKGAVAGVAATVAVDNARIYALQFMKRKNVDDWNLYRRFGLCRERLTGDITTSVAVLGVSVFDKLTGGHDKLYLGALTARLLGIMVGSTAAKYSTKAKV